MSGVLVFTRVAPPQLGIITHETMFHFNTLLALGFFLLSVSVLTLDQAATGAEGDLEVLVGPAQPIPPRTFSSELDTPFAIEFDSAGRMLIVEYDGGRLLAWTKKGGLVHLAGDRSAGYRDGEAKLAAFNKLHNLAILADDTVLLSDHVNHAIRKYDPSSDTISTYAGNGKSGAAKDGVQVKDAVFDQPICVALSPDQNKLLVADINNRVLRSINLPGGLVSIVAGNGTKGHIVEGAVATQTPLDDPRAAIQNDAGEIWFVQRNAHSLHKIDADGLVTTVAGDGKPGQTDGKANQAKFNGPKHMCFGPGGTVFIADDNNHAIRKYDPATHAVSTVDLGEYRLNRPHGVCVNDGWLYIADSFHHRILRVKL